MREEDQITVALMTSQQLDNRSQGLEVRVETLEAELKHLKQLLAGLLQKETPWWLDIAGSFEDDPTFEDAVQMGQDWRQSAELPTRWVTRSVFSDAPRD